MYDQICVGKRVRDLRELNDLTREQFAERVQLSSRFLADVENGEKGLSSHSLYNICSAFHVSSDYLLFGTLVNLPSPWGEIMAQIPSQYHGLIRDILKAFMKHE